MPAKVIHEEVERLLGGPVSRFSALMPVAPQRRAAGPVSSFLTFKPAPATESSLADERKVEHAPVWQ